MRAVMQLARLLVPALAAGSSRTEAGLSPPFRGWAFPYNASTPSNATPAVASNWLYPNEARLNLMPTGQPLWDPTIPTLGWSYCWDAPPGKRTFENGSFASTSDCRCPTPIGDWLAQSKPAVLGSVTHLRPRGTCADFKREVTKKVGAPTASGSRYVGAGLDECNLHNARTANEREAAAAGFRAARLAMPNVFLAAWGCNAGDDLFASLMEDGTFDLAMVEGYT